MVRDQTWIQWTATEFNRLFGTVVPKRVRRIGRNWLFPTAPSNPPAPSPPPDSRKRKEVLVDVVGSCNLRCPSCPVGNMGQINPTGLIKKELLDQMLEKANREYSVFQVSLYCWAEAFLHPELPELVRIVKNRGLQCNLSSNLNILRNAEELLRAKPDELRISLSGFTQETYGRTHAGGNIERVKENMRRLSEAKKKTGNTETAIHVSFHKYRHNLHEVEPMREFATSLGFGWLEDWAYYMPLEKVVALAEGTLGAEDQDFVDSRFALPIRQALVAAEKFKDEPCRLFDDQITLDLKGNLILCCGVYNYKANTLGSFLEMTPDEVDAAKQNHPTCATCVSHGIHRYAEFQGHPQLRGIFDDLVANNLNADSNTPSRVRPVRLSLELIRESPQRQNESA